MFPSAKLNLLRQAAQFMGDIPYDSRQGTPLSYLGDVCEVERLFSRASRRVTSSSPTPTAQEVIPEAGPSRARFSVRIEAPNKEKGTSRKRKKATASKKPSKKRQADVCESEDDDNEERPAPKRARVAVGEGLSSTSRSLRPRTVRSTRRSKRTLIP